MTNAPRYFSSLARRSSDPPISWLMKLALERRDLISLAVGFTDNDTLPVEEVARLTREILSKPKTARLALQYGSTIGLPQLRQEILRRWRTQETASQLYTFHQRSFAQSVSSDRGHIDEDDIVVTNGSQQLLYLVTEVLGDPGDIILVEDPTYFVYLGIVEAMGIRAVGFNSISTLPSRLEDLKRRRLLPRLKLLYLVTYFQNPTGNTWSLEMKREALAIVKHYELAAGHPIYIVEDAAYRDLRFEGDDVPSFKSLDPRNKRVIYSNTLTKPFSTGIRLGYGIVPPPLMQAVARSKGNHDFGSSNFLQAILARALAEGMYDRHLPAIANGYRRKRDAMIRELCKAGDVLGAASPPRFAGPGLGGDDAPTEVYETERLRFTNPRGGMYIWLELPPHIRTGAKSRLFKRAFDAGVLYVPGEMCYCHDPSRLIPQNRIRLSFGAPTVPEIKEGIRLLADALD